MSPAELKTAPSVGRLFLDRVAATPRREAFRYPAGSGWTSLTWEQTSERVKAIAAGLLALGLQPEECVAIACSTRVEWVLADYGVLCAGGAVTTVYPSTGAEDVAFIVSDSGSRFVVAEDEAQVAKLRQCRDQLTNVDKVIVVDGLPAASDAGWVITLADLEAQGESHLANHQRAQQSPAAAAGRCGREPVGGRRRDRRRRPRAPGDADLHLRHDRASQGGAADARQLDVRGRRGRGGRHPLGRRRAVPLAPAGALVRQGPAGRAGADRVRDRHRRPGRPDRREPLGHQAHVHGRRTADLREGLRPRRRYRRAGRRRQAQDLHLGLRRRRQGIQAARSGEAAHRSAEDPAHGGRPAGVLQDQGPDGRADPLLLLGQRGAGARDRRVVRRRRADHP